VRGTCSAIGYNGGAPWLISECAAEPGAAADRGAVSVLSGSCPVQRPRLLGGGAEVARQGLHLTKTFYRSPEGNAIVERFFRSLKEECVWQHQFASIEEAEKAIAEWIRFYNEQRPHSALGYVSPQEYRRARTAQDQAA
jgi:hypothetical protein